METALFNILIFPGIFFLTSLGFIAEYIDRKLSARFQNRIGPPWYQPLADFIKLVAKEDVICEDADAGIFKLMPVIALTSTITAFFYIPLWNHASLFSFEGDVIVVLYLLTIPTLAFFLGGWYSRSAYAMIGSMRTMTQLFAYEIPLFLVVLAPALLADTWSLSQMSLFYRDHPYFGFVNVIGFVISLIALLGKLEKVPFDIPEAETEIVAGNFTEYSGRLLAFIRLTMNVEMVVGSALVAAVFIPWQPDFGAVFGFFLFIVKILFVIMLLSFLRTVLARVRIDQMISLCWKYVAPLAFLQVLITLVLKGVFFS